MYGKHELVAQAFVYGDSLQSTLVGVIVPDEEQFMKWATENGKKGSFKELCADPAICKEVQKILDATGRANGLKGFENVKAIHLETEPFSGANDLLTPTFKLKVRTCCLFLATPSQAQVSFSDRGDV